MDAIERLQRALLDDDEEVEGGQNADITSYSAVGRGRTRTPTGHDRDDPTQAADLIHGRAHSYRNFHPEELRTLYQNVQATSDAPDADREAREEAQSVWAFIESGRLEPVVEAISDFFFKLDGDEQEVFTRRNPDMVMWMSVWNDTHGLNPYQRFADMAAESLGPERDAAADPPAFEREPPSDRYGDLLSDMMSRRRSYRNWSPEEFRDIMGEGKIAVSRGMARELDLYTPDARRDMDFPRTEPGRYLVRSLLDRVEAGRFNEVLAAFQKHYRMLDPDERRMVERRNPGLSTWMIAWGASEHVTTLDGREVETGYPPLATVGYTPSSSEEVFGGRLSGNVPATRQARQRGSSPADAIRSEFRLTQNSAMGGMQSLDFETNLPTPSRDINSSMVVVKGEIEKADFRLPRLPGLTQRVKPRFRRVVQQSSPPGGRMVTLDTREMGAARPDPRPDEVIAFIRLREDSVARNTAPGGFADPHVSIRGGDPSEMVSFFKRVEQRYSQEFSGEFPIETTNVPVQQGARAPADEWM